MTGEVVAARADVIMAGVGGKGVLTIGQIVAQAGLAQYQHATWIASYGLQMRGGASECTVVLSDEEIASPLVSRAGVVLLMAPGYVKAFEGRVRPGGTLIYDSAGMTEEVERGDIDVVAVPATEIGVGMGDARVANMVLLGAFVARSGVLEPGLVEAEIERRMGNWDKRELLTRNLEAFRRGMALVASGGR